MDIQPLNESIASSIFFIVIKLIYNNNANITLHIIMKRTFITNIIVAFASIMLVTTNALAQSFTLQGKVSDTDNNPIELANVAVVKQGKMTMTNLKGEFSIELQSEDSVVVRFSMIGYKTKTRVLRNPKGKQTLQIQLFSDTDMEEVQVTGTRRQVGQVQTIDTKDMKTMPSATGNVVEELIQGQAGVSTHNELSSQYNVRGGAFDENSVYINDVEVYRPSLVRSGQQEGLSVINPDMVKQINFSTGGFDAKYGDKMSSALDITYKRIEPKGGKKTIVEGSLAASLLGANAYIGIGTKKLSWLNGLRYKTNRYLLGSLETTGEYNPNFLDYQTYLSFRPNKRWTIDIIGNISENHYNFDPEDRETNFGTMENVKSFKVYFDGKEKDMFRTYFGTINITRHITDFTSLSLSASAFYTKEQETYDIQGQYWLTQTETSENLGVGTYMEHARNYLKANVETFKLTFNHRPRKHNILAGVSYRMEHIREKSREYEMRDSAGYTIPHTGNDLKMIYSLRAQNELKSHRIEAFIQDSYRFTSAGGHTLFNLNYGVRFSNWSYNKESIVSPRVSLTVNPAFNHNVMLRFATGLYYQSPFFKELRDTTTINGVTFARLNNKIKSQRSIHFIAGNVCG